MAETENKLIHAILSVELPPLWNFALQVTRNKHDAEDLVQKTCVRAIERGHLYKDSGKPKSWLFKLAQNLWTNELRAKAVRERGQIAQASMINEETRTLDKETPDALLEHQDVIKAVESLPEAQRMVILLNCVHGFSYSETASILQIPIGTVMSRIARARLSIGEQFLSHQTEAEKNTTAPLKSQKPKSTNMLRKDVAI